MGKIKLNKLNFNFLKFYLTHFLSFASPEFYETLIKSIVEFNQERIKNQRLVKLFPLNQSTASNKKNDELKKQKAADVIKEYDKLLLEVYLNAKNILIKEPITAEGYNVIIESKKDEHAYLHFEQKTLHSKFGRNDYLSDDYPGKETIKLNKIKSASKIIGVLSTFLSFET